MSSSNNNSTSDVDRVALYVTYINIVLYALCYQLQRPIEPFLIESLTKQTGDAATVSKTYGELQSFFSVIQTVGSPLVGILLDRVGIRIASAAVFGSSAASYWILARADNLSMLFVSKIPTLLQHAFLVAQATAATSTGGDASQRASALGRMTTAYTVGATIGPALGGFLVDSLGDLYLGAKLATIGSLISVVLSLLFLPTTHLPRQGEHHQLDESASKQRSFLQEVQNAINMLQRSTLWPLLSVKVVGGIAASMHSTSLPLVLTQKLHFEPSQLGISMSSSMFAVAAFGAIGMAPLTSMLGASGMANAGLISRAVMEIVLATVVAMATSNNASSFFSIVSVSVLHALASHALATGLTTQTTGAVDKSEQGALLGLEHGLFSMARIAGPPMGTFLLSTTGGFWSVALACGAIDVVLLGALAATAHLLSARTISGQQKEDIHSD